MRSLSLQITFVITMCIQFNSTYTLAEPEKLYWAQTVDDLIQRSDLNGTSQEDLFSFPQANNLIDIVVDPFSGNIFWAQEFEDRIYKANNDGTNPIPIIDFPLSNGIKAIAIDPLEQKIYFAHSIDDQIIRMDFDGNNAQVVFDFPVVLDVLDIAIDPVGRKFYWVESGNDRIRRKNLDGTGVIDELVSFPEASGVKDLALDIVGQKMYWSQTFNDRIRRSDFVGTNIETFLTSPTTAGVVDIQINQSGDTLFWAQSDDTIQQIGLSVEMPTLIHDWPDVSQPVAITIARDFGGTKIPTRPLPDPLGPGAMACNGGDNYGGACMTCSGGSRVGQLCLAASDCVDSLCEANDAFCPGGVCGGTIAVTATLPYPKSRFIGFAPNVDDSWVGAEVAIRVTLQSVPGFPDCDSEVRYAGAPASFCEGASCAVFFQGSLLQGVPHYTDWSTVGSVQIFGEEIVPGGRYVIQAVDIASDGPGLTNEDNFSSPGLIVDTAKWGDVISPLAGFSSATQPTVADVLSIVDKWLGAPNPVKARTQLQPAILNPTFGVGIADVLRGVDAWLGSPYPFSVTTCTPTP